jgi:dTDP-4-dehydrorhamnose 3,5-epimerase-like enzyme
MSNPTPEDALAPLPNPFTDDRGTIQNLVDQPLGSALVIRSKKGAVRGNHYHKTDFHFCWLEKGEMIYAHRPVGNTSAPQTWVIRPGQLFYSPPNFEHVMVFTQDSVMFVVAKNDRNSENYEEDTVRVDPIPARPGNP